METGTVVRRGDGAEFEAEGDAAAHLEAEGDDAAAHLERELLPARRRRIRSRFKANGRVGVEQAAGRLDMAAAAFLPPAKLFQLHSVSRQWRQVLTSAAVVAAAAAAATHRKQQRERERVVVACDNPNCPNQLKVVDVDLSFVPSWFWSPHRHDCRSVAHHSVVAAGAGLLCICNRMTYSCWCDRETGRPARYCVLNPVTRTLRAAAPGPVGPPVPFRPHGWLPLTATALTIYSWDEHDFRAWKLATCELRGGGEWTVLHNPVVAAVPAPSPAPGPLWWQPRPLLAQCGGETFWYHARRLHVLKAAAGDAGAGGGRRVLVEAAGALDGPSVSLLGLDANSTGYEDERVFLVAHQGAIFLVAHLMRRDRAAGTLAWDPELAAGVWRLARRRMAWEPVSRLEVGQVKRLLATDERSWPQRPGGACVGVRGARLAVLRSRPPQRPRMVCQSTPRHGLRLGLPSG